MSINRPNPSVISALFHSAWATPSAGSNTETGRAVIHRRNFLVGVGGLAAARAVATTPSRAAAAPPFVTSTHVGTYDFLRDPTINFQLNRWVSLGGDPLLREIQAMLPRLGTLAGCRDEFSAASDRLRRGTDAR